MLIIVIIIAAFLILYLMMFLRQTKDRKENEINAVEEFRNDYGKRNENFSQNNNRNNKRENSYTYKYVTKYNSPEDYREKRWTMEKILGIMQRFSDCQLFPNFNELADLAKETHTSYKSPSHIEPPSKKFPQL